MKLWKPWFFENSKIPVWLSYVSPINIAAITLGPVVISKSEMSEKTKRHETIHYQQYIDVLFVGFWPLYLFHWGLNLLRGMGGSEAYRNIPFEIEAYGNDHDENYLQNRKRYAWWGL